MSPLAYFRRRYRLHRSYSRHPRLSLASEILSTVGVGIVAVGLSALGYSMLTKRNQVPVQSQLNPVVTQQEVTQPVVTQQAVTQQENITEETIQQESATVIGSTPVIVTATAKVPTAKILTDVAQQESIPVALDPLRDADQVFGSEWILQLADDKFVIQFGTSPDRALIEQEARAFPDPPVAIYPFKRTPSSRLVYGYSSGVYDSLDEALRIVETLPQALVAYGPWIRPVAQLKEQIKRLSQPN